MVNKKRISETLMKFLDLHDVLMRSSKIKTDARKKIKLRDAWNDLWESNIQLAENELEKSVYRSYYGMITKKIFENLSLEDVSYFITQLIYNQLNSFENWR